MPVKTSNTESPLDGASSQGGRWPQPKEYPESDASPPRAAVGLVPTGATTERYQTPPRILRSSQRCREQLARCRDRNHEIVGSEPRVIIIAPRAKGHVVATRNTTQ